MTRNPAADVVAQLVSDADQADTKISVVGDQVLTATAADAGKVVQVADDGTLELVENATSALDVLTGIDNVLAYDSFNRADAATLGTATSGDAWTTVQGSAAVASNKAKIDGISIALATMNVGVADYDLSVRLSPTAATAGPVLRYIDPQNFLVVDYSSGSVRLRKVDLNTASVLTTATTAPSDGAISTLRCLVRGTRIQVFVDGHRLIDGTLTAGDATKYAGQTVVGLRGTTDTAARFDDFIVRGA